MYKKYISLFLTFLLISTTLCSCTNITTSKKSQNTTKAYYSVTAESIGYEINHYMELSARIPKITYSGIEKDELIDSINEEIYSKISKLVSEARESALEAYNSYVKTARNNTQMDQDAKLSDLDTKYRDVFNETDISGHASTNITIDPNLHNKNIIVVETTEASATSEVNSIESDNKNERFAGPEGLERGEKPNFENNERPKFENGEKPKIKNNKLSTQSEAKDLARPTKIASKSIVDEKLTVNDYYKELAEIDRITIPKDTELLLEYTQTKILCRFDVKCLDENYISLFIEFSETKTVPSIKRFFYNIDLHNKKILTIKDVLGEDYKTLCINTINSSIENLPENEKANLKSDYNVEEYITDDLPFFINNNHIPVIELDKFTLTPSYLEFQIIK